MTEKNNTPNSMQWFVIMIAAIWFCAALATAFSKDSTCMGAALVKPHSLDLLT